MRRGEVYAVDFGDAGAAPGGEAAGHRPAVVVSGDALNERLDAVVVVPLSSSDVERRARRRHNVLILVEDCAGLSRDSVAQTHLVGHVAKARIGAHVGTLSDLALDDIAVTLGEVLETRNPLRDEVLHEPGRAR